MLQRIDHVGIVVDSLEDAETFLKNVFELPLVSTIDRPERGLRAAFFRCGDVNLEVIELSDPDEREKRLGSGVSARIEHVAFEVKDLSASLKLLQALGVQANSEPVQVAGGLTTWTDPDSCDGVMYQLIERS